MTMFYYFISIKSKQGDTVNKRSPYSTIVDDLIVNMNMPQFDTLTIQHLYMKIK